MLAEAMPDSSKPKNFIEHSDEQVGVTKRACVRGLETGWITAGKPGNDVLLMLHGFPDTAAVWHEQIRHFAKRFHVIAPHIRGAGPSAPGDRVSRYGVEAVGLDCLDILHREGWDKDRPIHLVGHDLGAVHAWYLASLLGDQLASLTIINGLTVRQMAKRLANPRQLLRSWYMFVMQLPAVPDFLVAKHHEPMLRLAHSIGRRESNQRLSPARESFAPSFNQYRAFARSLLAWQRRGPVLKQPVQVIWARNDAFLEPPTQQEMQTEARHVQIRIVPGEHWLQTDHPELVNQLLERHFEHAST